ncbi:hypothetical protein [Muriicola sp. Z0-33]|uniref:hypothetical protein n=1 Tax=Muriicola sp. Z0-33 TaxID=2816957 RepID=UPI002237E0A7|nr:hypothetical protein [Muriicola sp. Z0-33]MCW5514744.1 hypothetical protein [Muriicola sp. Z0-33]
MSTSIDKLVIDSNQLQLALSALEIERNATVFTKRQNKMFKILQFSSIIYVAITVVTMIILSIDLIPRTSDSFFYFLLPFGLIQTILIFIIIWSYLPVSSLVKNIRQQTKRFRNLGFEEAISSPWKKEREKTKLLNIIDKILKVWTYLIIISCIYVFISFGVESGGAFLFVLLIIHFLINGLLSIGIVRRNNSRLQVIDRLYKSLVNYNMDANDKNMQILIPVDDYEVIAKIARAQIRRNQAISTIENDKQVKSGTFAILKSRNFKDSFRVLSESSRIAIQEQIDNFLLELESQTTKSTNKLATIAVPDIPLEILCQIEHDSNLVKIIAIENQTLN